MVDSAFLNVRYPFLIKSAQDNVEEGEGPKEIMRLRQATSARQSSERFMRAFQATFPRPKDSKIYKESGGRKLILLISVLLFNFRAILVEANQILSTYMPHMSYDPNLFLRGTLSR